MKYWKNKSETNEFSCLQEMVRKRIERWENRNGEEGMKRE